MEERTAIDQLGGQLIVFYNASVELIDAWRREADGIPDDLMIVADRNASLYDALGTERKSSYLGLARGSLGPVIRSAREGRIPKLTKADMLRLGADVAVRPDGEIARLHLASTPDDRLPFRDLLAALS